MSTLKSAVMMRVLLNRYHKSPPDNLMRFLPPAEAQAIRSWNLVNGDASKALFNPLENLQKIHYSWIEPILKQQPAVNRSLILAALHPAQREKIRNSLKLPKASVNEPPLAPNLRNYLLNLLYNKIKPKELLPIGFLPQTSLAPLTEFNKAQLVEFINFMGIHDLAESIRHIINKRFLSKLYDCLDAREKHTLRSCLHQPEKVVSTRMDLEKWDGDTKTLHNLMQSRGLIRLSKALCGQHPDFVWHLAHILDIGRGKILLQHYSKDALVGITPHLIQQVVNMIDLLSSKEGQTRDK